MFVTSTPVTCCRTSGTRPLAAFGFPRLETTARQRYWNERPDRTASASRTTNDVPLALAGFMLLVRFPAAGCRLR